MWYSKVTFISGKCKNVIFPTEEESNKFYKATKYETSRFLEDQYDQLLINLDNVETITKPLEYEEKE